MTLPSVPLVLSGAVCTHGWSFFGKVGGAKVTLDDGFSASMVKINPIMSANLKIVYLSIA